MRFKTYLEFKRSPFTFIKNEKKKENLPIWDIVGGVGFPDDETPDSFLNEEITSTEEDDDIHKICKHKTPNENELNSIKEYTDHSYTINRDSLHNKENPHHVHLDSWLNDASTKENTVLYHGLRKPPVIANDESHIGKFHNKMYLSTSSNFKAASRFAKRVKAGDSIQKHILKLYVPKNSKAASIREHSTSPDEHEILLHRNHTLEIHPEPTIQDGHTVWHTKVLT